MTLKLDLTLCAMITIIMSRSYFLSLNVRAEQHKSANTFA